MRAVFVAALSLLSGCLPIDEALNLDRLLDVFQPPSRVEIWLDVGDVTVEVGGRTKVERRLFWQGDVEPESDVRRVDGTLVIDGRCPPRARGCAVDVTLTVPEDTAVEVFTGVGDVVVSGVAGDLFVDTGAGFIDLAGVGGRIDVTTARGVAQGTGLRASEARFESKDGTIDLAFDASPEDLAAEAGTGDVLVEVPAGAYALDLVAVLGSVVIEAVEEDDAAPYRIAATSGGGDVVVTGAPR